MSYQQIREEYMSLQSQIEQIETTLKSMPEGKLLFSRSQNHVKWYVSDGHKKKYLPKKERALAEKLAAKKYLSVKLEALLRRKEALDFYFRCEPENEDAAERLLLEDSNYFELLSPYFQLKDEELVQWMTEPYDQNMKYPENLIHKASSGICVRSKSESMIELFLHTNQIPFRYECGLNLGGMTLYPDFTILHPRTRKIYYWEHFGLMDDPVYVKNACSKLEVYANHGIVPSIQLITTYETKDYPLSYQDIARIGAQYFL